jgi:hypothetical protein
MSDCSRSAAILLAVAFFAFGCAALSNARAAVAPAVPRSDQGAEDFRSVQAVCSRCHGVALFMNKPRTWNRWNEVFIRMSGHGARPTEEQVDHIVRYFLANLTYVNVNSSPADELALALGVSDAVANQIVSRREKQKFRGLADLRSIPGVDPVILQERKSRIQF